MLRARDAPEVDDAALYASGAPRGGGGGSLGGEGVERGGAAELGDLSLDPLEVAVDALNLALERVDGGALAAPGEGEEVAEDVHAHLSVVHDEVLVLVRDDAKQGGELLEGEFGKRLGELAGAAADGVAPDPALARRTRSGGPTKLAAAR